MMPSLAESLIERLNTAIQHIEDARREFPDSPQTTEVCLLWLTIEVNKTIADLQGETYV